MGSRLRFTAFTLLGVGVGTYFTTRENQILKEVKNCKVQIAFIVNR